MDQRLIQELPAGVHLRPWGGPNAEYLLMLWECWHTNRPIPHPPPYPIDFSPDYIDVVLRGMSRLVPGFMDYVKNGTIPRSTVVDGGYYTRTEENIPVIGAVDGMKPEGITWRLVCLDMV